MSRPRTTGPTSRDFGYTVAVRPARFLSLSLPVAVLVAACGGDDGAPAGPDAAPGIDAAVDAAIGPDAAVGTVDRKSVV